MTPMEIDIDGYGDECLWAVTDPDRPQPVQRRFEVHPIVWQAIVEKWGKR